MPKTISNTAVIINNAASYIPTQSINKIVLIEVTNFLCGLGDLLDR